MAVHQRLLLCCSGFERRGGAADVGGIAVGARKVSEHCLVRVDWAGSAGDAIRARVSRVALAVGDGGAGLDALHVVGAVDADVLGVDEVHVVVAVAHTRSLTHRPCRRCGVGRALATSPAIHVGILRAGGQQRVGDHLPGVARECPLARQDRGHIVLCVEGVPAVELLSPHLGCVGRDSRGLSRVEGQLVTFSAGAQENVGGILHDDVLEPDDPKENEERHLSKRVQMHYPVSSLRAHVVLSVDVLQLDLLARGGSHADVPSLPPRDVPRARPWRRAHAQVVADCRGAFAGDDLAEHEA
mmetsp:Transcript_47398/g.148265  ORF Transcript_47398/g.148265 Transcript_47398/m.148265 type:complete len:299 (+) Transcript_47398:951-1847(+)